MNYGSWSETLDEMLAGLQEQGPANDYGLSGAELVILQRFRRWTQSIESEEREAA